MTKSTNRQELSDAWTLMWMLLFSIEVGDLTPAEARRVFTDVYPENTFCKVTNEK